MKKYFLLILILFISCNQKNEKEIIEESIKTGLQDYYFSQNKNIKIHKLIVNEITYCDTDSILGRFIKNRLLALAKEKSGLSIEEFHNLNVNLYQSYLDEVENSNDFFKYKNYLKRFKQSQNIIEVKTDFKYTTTNLEGQNISNHIQKDFSFYVATVENNFEVINPN